MLTHRSLFAQNIQEGRPRRLALSPAWKRISGCALPFALVASFSASFSLSGVFAERTQAQTPVASPPVAPVASSIPGTAPLVDEKGQRLDVALDVLRVGSASAPLVTAPGTSTVETLRGNGTRNGYMLNHNAVIASSLSIYVGGRRLRADQDYWLDTDGGTLFFADPVRASDTISVTYRYLEGAQAPARIASGLQINLTDKTSLNMLYGMNSRQEGGLNLALNGLRLNSQFGKDSHSRYTSLAYFSDMQRSANANLSWRDVMNDPKKSGAAPFLPASSSLVGSGYLLSQSLAMQTGGMRVSADFQDISRQFAGFADLKKGAASDKTALDQLTQLEKERGLQRLGFGFGIGGSVSGKKPGGLSLDWGQIEDHSAEKKSANLLVLGGGNPATATPISSAVPAFRRESLSLGMGLLNFSVSHRSLVGGFTRLGDLSNDDKNAFLLDARRLFDTGAKVEQITQAERDQVGKIGALSPDVMLSRLQLGGSERNGVVTFGQISLGVQQTAPAPAASAPASAALTSTANASRATLFSGLMGEQQNKGIARQILGFNSAHLQFSLSSQSILNDFTQFASLSDADKLRFGKENGLKRDQMSFLWQTDKNTKIGFDKLRVAGTSDAIEVAVAQATKDSKDTTVARTTAASETSSQSFHLETKGLKFVANEAHTDKTFTRAADLALSDADKQQIERERGYDRKDYTLHLDAIKGVVIDSYTYRAENPTDKLLHDVARNTLLFAPTKKLSLSYATDHDLTTTTDDKGAMTRKGGTHSALALKSLLAQNISVTAQRDETLTLDKSAPTQSAILDVLSLGTPKDKKGAGLDYSDKRIAYKNGNYDNTVEFNIHAKPTANLSLQVGRRDIDRRVDTKDTKPEDKLDGLVSTESVELDFQATKNFSIILGGSQTEVPDAPKTAQTDAAATTGTTASPDAKPADKPIPTLTDSSSLTVGMKGEPIKNVTLAAKFDELHDVGKNTKDVADVSIGNTKPLKFGAMQELTVKAGYVSLNDKRMLQNEAMTGHASWKMWKHEFLLDYGGFSKLEGKTLNEITSRTYSFKTDPTPQRWFHGSFFYKVRTLADGKDRLVRKFTADVLLHKNTHIAYTYGILPENDGGEMQPLETLDVSITHAFRPRANLSLFYRRSDRQPTLLGKPDPAATTWTHSAGVGWEGALGAKGKWGLSVSRDTNGYGLFHDYSNRVRASLDQPFSSDNFLTLSTEYRTHDGKDSDGKDLHNEVRTTLDFSHRF